MGEHKKREGEKPFKKFDRKPPYKPANKSFNKFNKKLAREKTNYEVAKELLFVTKPKVEAKTDDERQADDDFVELLKIFGDGAREGDEVVLYPTDEKKRLTTKVSQIKEAILSSKKSFSQYYAVAYLLVYQYGFAMDMKIDIKTYMEIDFSLPDLLAEGSPFFALVKEVFQENSPAFLEDGKEVALLKEKMEKLCGESEHYDQALIPHLKNWSWERISLTKKTILRLASYFIEHEDLSKKFIISESVNLAKWFGEDKDYGFINAILSKKFI